MTIRGPFALKFAVSILLSSCFFVCGCRAFFFYNEPDTNIITSPSFNIGGRNYFLLKCKIYRAPKGIARFPDGGTSKTVFESIYLMALKDFFSKKIVEIGEIKGSRGTYFKSSKIRGKKGGLLIKIGGYDSKVFKRKDSYFFFNAKTGEVSEIKKVDGDWPEKNLTIGETGDFFKDFSGFDSMGLANPLDFIHGAKKPEDLSSIILKGKGDRYLRLAAAKRLIDSGNENLLKKVMARFDKYTKFSNKFWRDEEKALIEKMIEEGEKGE